MSKAKVDANVRALVHEYAKDRYEILFSEMAAHHGWGCEDTFKKLHARRALHLLPGWKLNFPVGKEPYWSRGR